MSDLKKTPEHKPRHPTGAMKALGLLIALLGGLAAVAAGVYVSHTSTPLWGLILVAWMVSEVRDADEYPMHPIARGGVVLLVSIGIGAAAVFLSNAEVLWALLFVVLFVDDVV